MPQLSTQRYAPDTCECIIEESWWRYFCSDCTTYFNAATNWCNYHNRATNARDNCEFNSDEPDHLDKQKTLISFVNKCQHHQMSDQGAYNQLKKDNFNKNDSMTEMIEFFGYEDAGGWDAFKDEMLDTTTYPDGYYYTGTGTERVCHFVMKGLTQGQLNSLQTRLDNRLGVGEIVVE